nr:hypothetical protein [Tanacetum cinerariifolium]
MDMKIDQQVALDEALVPHARRLRIGKSNFRLRSDITSKESTLQATTTVHHHSIHFKMNNKKCIVNLEYFKEMLHICLRIPNQTFDEIPFEEEIRAFLRYLGHSYDSLRLSQAQILWGMYHKKNVNFAYILWEDFVYQVEYKDAKKRNEIYYPRFTKVIINFFMTKDPSIPKRNKVNWHYVRDDQMFTTLKLVSRHQNTQQFGAIFPVELTNEDIKNSAAYKEYYAIASGAAPPKKKATKGKQPAKSSKAKGLSVLSEVALTKAEQIKLATKRILQQTHISQASRSGADEGTGIIPGVPDVPNYESDKEISWKSSDEDDDDNVDDQSDAGDDDHQEDEDEQDDDDQYNNDDDQDSDNDGDDFIYPKLSTHDEEAKDEDSFDPIVQTPSQVENYNDEINDDEIHGMNVGGDKAPDVEDDDEMYGDVNINLEGRDVQMTDVHTTQVLEDTYVTLTRVWSTQVLIQIIKEQVKEQVNVQVSKILPKIEKTVNEQLKAEVLTRASNSSKTSYVVAADLSELELKKILIKKLESNKSIHRSDEQRNLYNAQVDAYEYTLTPELLVGPTYELMKGLCKSLVELELFLEEDYKVTTDQLDWNNPEGQQYPHNLLKSLPLIPNSRGCRVIPFDHFINNNLEYLRGGASNRKYTTYVTKTKALDYGHIKWIEDLFYGFATNRESARDVYSKCRIIAVTELQIVEWHNYKHLDWIIVRCSREASFQRRMEDLQLGVKSYQKKLNLTKPDTYRSDLKRKEAYTAYSNPRGFIYQNKDKQNRLMRIDELHKFSDGTLNDVRTALDDCLKGIRMKYFPQTIWRRSDKERAGAMIQAIDKQLKTKRIVRSLEKFISGRLYDGDFRMLQRTI